VRHALLATVSLAGLAWSAPGAEAQHSQPGIVRPSAPDSAAAVRAARRAQGDFERNRRWWLPLDKSGGRGGGECDAIMGRICYWYDENEPDPEPEPERIVRARTALVARLDELGRRSPGDPQIAALRVWYRIDGGDTSGAVSVARDCAADAWWCDALRGMALHTARAYAASDSAFAAALAAMPEKERCAFTDLSPMLPNGDLRDRYRKTQCAARAPLDARIWWLAQPLHTLGANDLRTEHLSRATLVRIFRRIDNTHGLSWGRDLEELTLRYGWSTWWTRLSIIGTSSGEIRVSGHSPVPAYAFFPSERVMTDPLAAEAEDWSLRDRLTVARYAPAYAAPMRESVPHQAAVFRRGDSMLVVVRYDVSEDTLFRDARLVAGVALAPDERRPPAVVTADGAAAGGVLLARGGWAEQLFSLEVRATDAPRAARTRYAVRPPDPSGKISGILLFDPKDGVPPTLADALPRLLSSDAVRAGEQVGLLWESYGVRGPVDVSVTLTRTVAGVGRRAAEALRIVERPSPLEIRWSDSPPAGEEARWTGSVLVNVGEKPPGVYRLDVTLKEPDGRTYTTSRSVQIEERRR
jgi:hypothetical protein